jgi:hypothetical protein
MANNDISFTIDTSALNTEYTFIGDVNDLPEGTITLDTTIPATSYTLVGDADFYSFNSGDYTVSDISVTFGDDVITINTDD